MQPLVLLYNLTDDTPAGKTLRKIFLTRGIACGDIPEEQLGATIGDLLGMDGMIDGAHEADASEITDDILTSHLRLMCGFDESLLDQFLADMRAASVRIPHKAMLTETNVGFTVAQLIRDISREHQMMQMMAKSK